MDNAYIPQYSANAELTAFKTVSGHEDTPGYGRTETKILTANAGGWQTAGGVGGGGLEAGASLIKARAGPFNLNLGVGVDTGAGIRDDSVTVKALGTGFTVGRKMEVSALGSSFGVDLGNIFWK